MSTLSDKRRMDELEILDAEMEQCRGLALIKMRGIFTGFFAEFMSKTFAKMCFDGEKAAIRAATTVGLSRMELCALAEDPEGFEIEITRQWEDQKNWEEIAQHEQQMIGGW